MDHLLSAFPFLQNPVAVERMLIAYLLNIGSCLPIITAHIASVLMKEEAKPLANAKLSRQPANFAGTTSQIQQIVCSETVCTTQQIFAVPQIVVRTRRMMLRDNSVLMVNLAKTVVLQSIRALLCQRHLRHDSLRSFLLQPAYHK